MTCALQELGIKGATLAGGVMSPSFRLATMMVNLDPGGNEIFTGSEMAVGGKGVRQSLLHFVERFYKAKGIQKGLSVDLALKSQEAYFTQALTQAELWAASFVNPLFYAAQVSVARLEEAIKKNLVPGCEDFIIDRPEAQPTNEPF